jgi:subtilase family serine protease
MVSHRFIGDHDTPLAHVSVRRWPGMQPAAICETLESRRHLSAVISRPGKPVVADISAAGANDISWASSIDSDGGIISYTLFYERLGSGIASSAGVTTGNALPLCEGSPTNHINAKTIYLVWVTAYDELSGANRTSRFTGFRTRPPLTPATVRQAYGLNAVYHRGYSGQGETIGLVEEGSDPTLASDIGNFDRLFHLQAPSLEVINSVGTSTPLPADLGHGHEIALDVEWAHAIAPDAKILVVEGNGSVGDLATSAQEAGDLGASVVSISYGYTQAGFSAAISGTVQQLDSSFQRSGVTFVAAAGDYFGQPEWPSVSNDVIAVGGTQLSLHPSNVSQSQVLWQDLSDDDSTKGSGSGFGQFSSQIDPSTRQTPDVSYAADGFAWYFDGSLSTDGWGDQLRRPAMGRINRPGGPGAAA